MDEPERALPVLLTLLVSLVAFLFGSRALRTRGLVDAHARWRKTPSGRGAGALVPVLVALASAPLVFGFGVLVGPNAALPGDASSHARVAHALAEVGLPHGWIDVHSGGFLWGPHYQSVPILLLVGLVKLGVSARAATQGLGLSCLIALPLAYAAACRRAGARPIPALLGALLLSWVSPFQAFVGGPSVYLSQGLVSQAFAAVVLVFVAVVVLDSSWPWAPPLLGALCIASHAQLALCAFAAATPAVFLAAPRSVRRRFVFAAAGAAVFGLAHYGPGVQMLAVPYSWAKVTPLQIVGYGPERLGEWLFEGRLLDSGRAPALTGLVFVGVLALLLTQRSMASRGALLFLVTALGLSVVGPTLVGLGPPATRLVEVFSPVRMLGLVPFAAACVLTVAGTELGARLTPSWARAVGLAALSIATVGAGLPTLEALGGRVQFEAAAPVNECEPVPVAGYDSGVIASWIRGLRGGRLVFDGDSFLRNCPSLRGAEVESPVPGGVGLGGPGSAVGVNLLAFDELHASRPGGAARAESLGIRWILHTRAFRPAPAGAWRRVTFAGDVELSERVGGTDTVGLGCVTSQWSGADKALRDALFDDLPRAESVTSSPLVFTSLKAGEGPVTREVRPADGCDAASARVREVPREPGAYEASVSAPAPVDVVIRATYVPTWLVRVDGEPRPIVRVAPGFFAVRVGPGEHHVEAVVDWPSEYGTGLVLAATATVLLALASRRVAR